MRTLPFLALLIACTDKSTDDSGGADDSSSQETSPTFDPAGDQTGSVGGTTDYTITGLTDDQAYRVTLVLSSNITLNGDGTATLVDADANGAADAGASEAVATITKVNGADVTATKTVPSVDDDPMNPSGVFPSGGEIVFTVTGVAAGSVVPVAYENGGVSTFLEVDSAGTPTEIYGVAGTLTIQ